MYKVFEEVSCWGDLEEVWLIAIKVCDQESHTIWTGACCIGLGLELAGHLVHQRLGWDRDSKLVNMVVSLSLHEVVDDSGISCES